MKVDAGRRGSRSSRKPEPMQFEFQTESITPLKFEVADH